MGWSDLPEDLVDGIANCMSSNLDIILIRSICKPWRSALATKKLSPKLLERNLPRFNSTPTRLHTATSFRVTQPSSPCPNKGWLITTRQIGLHKKIRLASPFSGHIINLYNQTLDLLNFRVSEIRQSYEIHPFSSSRFHVSLNKSLDSSRVVLVGNLVIVLNRNRQIWWCKNGEESDNKWTRIESEINFLDIMVHKGQVYVLDSDGVIWWIRLSDLSLIQFILSSLSHHNMMIYDGRDMRLVEYCGDLCIVHRLWKNSPEIKIEKCCKVYKMDQELTRWVEISSLGDSTLIVANDSCFMVLAFEYYGCLANAIYFFDKDHDTQVFSLDDGRFMKTADIFSQLMFSPPFF